MEKNIALFSYTLLSGGAEKQLIMLANNFSSRYNITIFVYFHDKIDKGMISILNKNENLSIVLLKGSILNKFFLLRRELKQRNIDHFFSYLTFPNLFGSVVAKISGVSMIFGGIRSAYLPKKKWNIECIVNRYISDYTIFNNYKGEKNSHLFGLSPKKNIVISNCLEKSGHLRSISKNDNYPIIITVGRFVEEKDYKTALRSIEILHKKGFKFRYIIVGYGKLESHIRKIIHLMALKDIVKIIIKPSDVYSYLLKSDLYLSTSLFEGTSNSILEAMNSDLPVVATNVGDNNYLIEEGYNGFLVEKGDIKGLSKRIEILLTNKDQREKMGINNRDVINRKFSKEVFHNKYTALLNIEKK